MKKKASKKKTSFSIDEELLSEAKRIAARFDRSTSWLLNKLATIGLRAADKSQNLGQALEQFAKDLEGRDDGGNKK